MTKLLQRLILVIAIVAILPLSAFAQNFTLEGKTVTWIVGFREGGGTDRLTRILQAKLSQHLPGNPNIIVLNKPGGGSVTASNAFQREAPNDGTMLIMASTSGILPVLLGSSVAEYNPNEWPAIAGFARGATLFGIVSQTGTGTGHAKTDLQALKSANIRFGLETPYLR